MCDGVSCEEEIECKNVCVHQEELSEMSARGEQGSQKVQGQCLSEDGNNLERKGKRFDGRAKEAMRWSQYHLFKTYRAALIILS